MSSPSSSNQPNRRKFISTSSKLAAAGAIGATLAPKPSFGFHNSVDDQLKIGLIGCGGRGTGAVLNAAGADSNSKVIALADAFGDRIDSCAKSLESQLKEKGQYDVADDHKFTGIDCHEAMCASDIDVVLLATPPYFRPMQLKAAVDAGKHVFCEKPVGVDVPGVRSVMESCQEAAKKGLAVVSGLCYRYDVNVNEMIKQIKNGAIGDIRMIQENYLTGTLWHRGNKEDWAKWSKMEYQLRNWLYFNWLAGDHIAEQHIHSLDKALWLMDDVPPKSCYATGGRLVRTGEKWGNVYDHFSTCYEWEDSDIKVLSSCRQMAGCFNETEDHIVGTKGTAKILKGDIINENGKANYKEKRTPSMYDVEHKELFASIRAGRPINNGTYMSYATLMALIGRDSAYTGQKIMWEDFMKSEKVLGPKDVFKTPDYVPDPVAMPGGEW